MNCPLENRFQLRMEQGEIARPEIQESDVFLDKMRSTLVQSTIHYLIDPFVDLHYRLVRCNWGSMKHRIEKKGFE